jgi:hypothetical protein
MRLVGAFVSNRKGYFVEVGANEPRERSQSSQLLAPAAQEAGGEDGEGLRALVGSFCQTHV